MIFAIYGANKGWKTKVLSWEDRVEVTAYIPRSAENEINNLSGCVYVLSGDSFDDKLNHQFKSHGPVKVLGKIDVNISDYLVGGGKIVWT